MATPQHAKTVSKRVVTSFYMSFHRLFNNRKLQGRYLLCLQRLMNTD
jgi:hypothetical protein